MIRATLYPLRRTGSTFDLEFTMDDANFARLKQTAIGASVSLDGIVAKGRSTGQDEIFIKNEYEQLFTGNIKLQSVKVTKVHADPLVDSLDGGGNIYAKGVMVTLQGVRANVATDED